MKPNEVEEIVSVIESYFQTIADRLNKLERSVLELKLKDRLSFSLKEAAELVGMSHESLYKYSQNGKIKYTQPGGKQGAILILREDLIEFISTRAAKDESFVNPNQKNKQIKK